MDRRDPDPSAPQPATVRPGASQVGAQSWVRPSQQYGRGLFAARIGQLWSMPVELYRPSQASRLYLLLVSWQRYDRELWSGPAVFGALHSGDCAGYPGLGGPLPDPL